MKKQQAFTLVELLVVVGIISILATIGLTSYSSITKQSRDAKKKGDLESLRSALELYRSDNNYYPTELNLLVTGKYLQSIPTPIKASPYCYFPEPTVAGDSGITNYGLYTQLEGSSSLNTVSCLGIANYPYNYKLTPLGAE
jgi:prepilin-type N-terminal cleavage/methylation domain-containing protein